MIPVELSLKNFMSYGTNVGPIPFSSFDLACLTGENGNGKSAILDAITWALWGQARGVDKNGAGMDDLVRLGQEEMEVQLLFELERDIYRVIRKRDKRRGISLLELQIKDDGNFRVISGDKIAETQKKIIQILKMDYETFINSAYVLQGKADTFTQQKPNDRKRILGEILGLSLYDELEKRAREKARWHEQQAGLLQQKIDSLKEETKDKENLKLLLKEISYKVEYSSQLIKAKDLEYQTLIEAKQDYDEALTTATQLQERTNADSLEIRKLEEAIQSTFFKINQGKLLLDKEDEVKKGHQQYQQTLELREECQRKQNRYFELLEAKGKLESVINNSQKTLEINLANIRKDINELSALTGVKGDKLDELNLIKKALEDFENLKELKLQKEATLKELETEYGILKARVPDLKERLQSLKENYITLKKSPKCPYCSTDLTSTDSKQQVLRVLASEGKEFSGRLSSLEERSKKVEEETKGLQMDLDKLREQLSEKELKSKQLSLIERDLEMLRIQEEKLGIKLKEEEEIVQTLASDNFMESERKELSRVLAEIQLLNFNKNDIEDINKRLENLNIFNNKMAQLAVVRESLKEQESSLKYYQETKARKVKAIQDDEALTKILFKRAQELKDVPEKMDAILSQLEKLKLDLSLLQQEKGSVLTRHERCVLLGKELKIKEQEWLKSLSEKSYYSELTQAFGKKGIQAIIIENAIPELQDESNNLLNKMTDGRLNVALVTQRGTKSGNLVETLDIQISDELGTRKYEMYSGGEAFRVNFALRIALSKLLARRAGASLQTLFIDEGFGTQDGKGRERLIELINSIKGDFRKIIVITHIQELKDAFPVHLEVRKGQEGSAIAIS